jgi:hypothetical protein
MCNECNSSATICSPATECSCPVKDLSTDCVQYTGDDLACSGIKKGTILTEFLQQLDEFVCNAISQSAVGYVPYTGAVTGVDLGNFDMKVQGITIGKGKFYDHSLVIGELAGGNSGIGGSGNLAIGYKALFSGLQACYQNFAIGHETLSKNTIGQANMAVGYAALTENITGNGNTAIGRNAMKNATSPENCNAIGNGALIFADVTEASTANGFLSLAGNSGNENTAMGATSGWGNGLGFTPGTSPGTGIGNSMFGNAAMASLADGNFNVAVGHSAAGFLTNGEENVAIGYLAGHQGVATVGNVAVGARALQSNTTGNHNTVVGWGAQASNVDECVVLGREAAATADNQFVVGSTLYPAGMLSTETNTSTKVWNVIINGVPQKILLA